MSLPHRGAAIAGIAAIVCYICAVFAPLPDFVSRLLAFAFGPLYAVGFVGIYNFLNAHRPRTLTQVGCAFGVAGGVLLTAMLVIQIGNGMWLETGLSAATTDAAKDAARATWGAIDHVQLLLDVVMDIFLCAATVLVGIAMWTRPKLGPIFGGLGVVLGLLLLTLNLQTFPIPPAGAGSFDAGPFVSLWYLAVFLRLALAKNVVMVDES